MSKRRRHLPPGFCQDSFGRGQAGRKPPKSVLIVTEGRSTEPRYFQALADLWNIHPKVIHIEPGGEGIPANLVRRANVEIEDLRKRGQKGRLAYNELGEFDEIWIVFDTEHAQRQGRLDDGVAASREAGFHIAHSTPCFEFWLALHYAPNAPAMDACDQAIRLLEDVGGLSHGDYSKSHGFTKDLMEALVQNVAAAVRNAVVVSRNQQGETFPGNPSTSVQKLICSIHEVLPEALKNRYPLP